MKLVIIFGPPAVGKMTVGFELERLTGLKLFHNHMTIDLVLRFFPFGSPPFGRLNTEFRRRIFEEVAESGLPGLIFTYVWALDHPGDREHVDGLADIFRRRGAEVCYVELAATQEERLRRNETELRLAEKRPKRDLEFSRRNLLAIDEKHRVNTVDGDFFYPEHHLRIDNTHLAPDEVARRIVEAFGL
ncbi:MAG TPA: AAA family ATPase [Longimicrobium sp.]|nr:AAA family ATPase [Longimicrobium sp.]